MRESLYYESIIDQLHTLAAERLKLAVIIPVMQRDMQAQAPLNVTYIQKSQMRFARLNSEVPQEILQLIYIPDSLFPHELCNQFLEVGRE